MIEIFALLLVATASFAIGMIIGEHSAKKEYERLKPPITNVTKFIHTPTKGCK